jgi:hypothetical protein
MSTPVKVLTTTGLLTKNRCTTPSARSSATEESKPSAPPIRTMTSTAERRICRIDVQERDRRALGTAVNGSALGAFLPAGTAAFEPSAVCGPPATRPSIDGHRLDSSQTAQSRLPCLQSTLPLAPTEQPSRSPSRHYRFRDMTGDVGPAGDGLDRQLERPALRTLFLDAGYEHSPHPVAPWRLMGPPSRRDRWGPSDRLVRRGRVPVPRRPREHSSTSPNIRRSCRTRRPRDS